jgi:hypothetical protein
MGDEQTEARRQAYANRQRGLNQSPPQVEIPRRPVRSQDRRKGHPGRIIGTLIGLVLLGVLAAVLFAHHSSTTPPSGYSSDPWTAVQTYYNYVNEADYSAAWNMLSPAFQAANNEGNYSNFVAGYEGHNQAHVAESSESGDMVNVTLTSPTSSWSASGWYQVENGKIIAGHLTDN